MKIFMVLLTLAVFILSCSKTEKNTLSSEYNTANLQKLLVVAKTSIIEELEYNKIKTFTDLNYSNDDIGIFVRLLKNNRERGCIGFLKGVHDVEESVKIAAINAAFFDPRFPGLKKNELKDLYIEVTVIGKLVKMNNPYDFTIGRHSLLIDNKLYRGFLQAQIAVEQKYNKKNFLAALCRKAKLPESCYNDKNAEIYKADTVYLRMKFKDTTIDEKKSHVDSF